MILLIISFFLFLGGESFATVRYVHNLSSTYPLDCANGSSTYNPSGSGSCTGGSDLVYSSIANGVAAMQNGDTLDIRGGTYAEQIFLDTSWISSSYATGTFVQGHAGETVTLIPTTPNGGVIVVIGSTDYITIKNIRADGSYMTNTETVVGGGGNHVRYDGVWAYNCGRLTLKACQGVGLASDNEFINGKVFDNGITTPPYFFDGTQAGYGFYAKGARMLIANNEIYNNACIGMHVYNADWPTSHTDDTQVSGNTIHDNGDVCYDAGGSLQVGAQILIWSGTRHKVFNNVVYGGSAVRSGDGINVQTLGNGAFYNNTVYGVSRWGFVIDRSSNFFRNNIVVESGDTNILDTAGSNTYSNNLCFGTGGTGNCQVSGQNPLFANPSTGDFHLQTGSPAINAGTASICSACGPGGTPITISSYSGSAPDIGALETLAPPPTIVVNTPSQTGKYITTQSTVTLTGIASCSTGIASVAWSNDRGGIGQATGTTSWTITDAALVENYVNNFTITVNCAAGGGSASATLLVRANGTSKAVLLLSFDEGTGTTAADASGLKNNASFAGSGNAWGTGQFGTGVVLNGSGSLTVPTATNLNLSTYTISMWVNPSSTSTTWRPLLSKGTEEKYFLYGSVESGYCGTGAVITGFAGDAVFNAACQAVPLAANAWVYLTGTYDGSQIKLYRGTSLVATFDTTQLALESSGVLNIGANTYGQGFQGIIDEVRLYNYALPLNNGTGDDCADSTPSITRDMNCRIAQPVGPPVWVLYPDAAKEFFPDANIIVQ